MNLENTRAWLKPRLSEERYLHSLGVEETARELALMFSVDEQKAALAGLIHDNAKDIPYEQMLAIVKENNFEIEEDVSNNRKILHAYLGAYLARKELNIEDREILDGIKFHTTGKPDMSVFEKIIFISDKIEANTRELDYRCEVLNIINESKNLDKAVLYCVENTIMSLLERKLPISSVTVDVWNYYLPRAAGYTDFNK